MAVTVTFSFELLQSLDFATGPAVGNVDVVGLANGGFAAVGQAANLFSNIEVYSSALALTAFPSGALKDASIAQLSNGNLAVVSRTGDDEGVLDIYDLAGNQIVDGQFFASIDGATAVDIAALAGGNFVVVNSELTAPGNSFARARIFNNAGTQLLDLGTIGVSVDTVAAVAALDDGGFAIAYVLQFANSSRLFLEVHNANGSERFSGFIDEGSAANSIGDVAITATDGGFAIVYRDGAVGFNGDIRLTRFNSSGVQLDTGTLTGPATIDEAPSITRMPDGLLAVGSGYSYVGTADSETFIGLFDPATNTFLAVRETLMGNPVTDDTDDPEIAAFGSGRVAMYHTNRTDNDVDGEALEVVRTSTGDASGEIFNPSSYRDVQNGGGGSDFLDGGGNNDTLNGGAGDDNIFGGAGNDTLIGGADIDTAFYTGTAAVTVNLSLTTAQNTGGAGIDTLSGIENLVGGNGNDVLTGNSLANRLDGAVGNDRLAGGGGNDIYQVDAGDIVTEGLNAGYDTVNTTRLSYALPANVDRVNFTGSGNFVGTGNNLANRFQSGDGDDRFVDILGGADIFSGGNGNDTVDFRTSAAGAVLNFTTNNHTGAATGDSYSSIEKFLGSDTAADSMTMGGTGRALFVGGGGNDTLVGGIKNDQLIGQGGSDILSGGADRDSLDGGTGNDAMTGGAAGDVFVFIDAAFGQDTIADYQDGIDSFKIFSAVADNISDFSIANNGSASVTLTLGGNSITINGAAPINITAADFFFY